jgi:hypothetical protein
MGDQRPLPPAPSLGKVLTDVFASPSDIFQSVKGTASTPMLWVMPLIAMFLITVLSSVILFTNASLKTEMKEIQGKAMKKMVDNGKRTQEQADQLKQKPNQ